MMEPEKPTSVPPKDSEPIPATPVSEPKEDMRGDVLQVSDFTPEEERRIRRKIDYYVLPIVSTRTQYLIAKVFTNSHKLCMVFLVQCMETLSPQISLLVVNHGARSRQAKFELCGRLRSQE